MSHDHALEAEQLTGKAVSRRAAIRIGGRAAVTTAAGGLLVAAGGTAAHAAMRSAAAPAGQVQPAAARGATFQGTQDWTGTYIGVLDGRPATLSIGASIPYAGDTNYLGIQHLAHRPRRRSVLDPRRLDRQRRPPGS